MERKPMERLWTAAGLLLAAILGVPTLAEAQLFPNLPSRKRERPACETEPPYFKAVRHQYYGYFPTCWRKFPQGWGCPCPKPEDLPGLAVDRPRGPGAETPTERELSVEPPTNPANPTGPDGTTPPLPKERDLFSIPDDSRPAAPSGPLPEPPAGNPAPAPAPTPMPPSVNVGPVPNDPFGDIVAGAPAVRTSAPLLDPGSPSIPAPPIVNAEPLPGPPPAVAAPPAPRRSLLTGFFNRIRR